MQLVQEGPKQQGKAGFDTQRAANFYRFKVHQHTGDDDDDDGDNCGDDNYYHQYCSVEVMMMMMIAKLCKLFLL